MKFSKKFFVPVIAIAGSLLLPSFASAVCPVCTVTVTAGVGLCRWLGVDDTISGTWIGGLIISTIIWTLSWLDKKKIPISSRILDVVGIKFKLRKILVTLGYYTMVVLPLYFTDIVGHPRNKLWGFDKLLLGIFSGSILFLLGVYLTGYLKKKNNGKVYVPFQNVIIPVSLLVIASIIFYFIVKCQ